MGAEESDTLAGRMLALNQKLIEEYLKGLDHVRPAVRAKSARGLAGLRGLASEAVPALERRLGDPDRRVRQAAASALQAIRSYGGPPSSG
jgi:HEAT repeat protein